jgi:hypothetical protein
MVSWSPFRKVAAHANHQQCFDCGLAPVRDTHLFVWISDPAEHDDESAVTVALNSSDHQAPPHKSMVPRGRPAALS